MKLTLSITINILKTKTKGLVMHRGIVIFTALIISGNSFAIEVQERSQEQMQIQQQEQIRENQIEQERLREQDRIRSEQSNEEKAQERSFPESPSFRGDNFGSGRGQGGGGRRR